MKRAYTKTVSLQKLIAYATGQILQVGRGYGNTIDNPIEILENHHGLAIDLEQEVMEIVAIFYGMWKARKGNVTLLEYNGRNIDRVEVIFKARNGGETSSYIYFDITSAFKNIRKTLEQVKTKEELDALHSNDYYKKMDDVPHFFAAAYYAFDLEEDEEFTPETLQKALALDSADEARDIYDKLLECGF